MHIAAQHGHVAILQALIDERNGQIEAKDNKGDTVLHYATHFGHIAVINALIEKNAQIEARGERGLTAMHIAARNGNVTVLNALIQHNAQKEAKDDNGNTPLHYAACFGRIATLNALIYEYKAPPEAQNYVNQTPLDLAISSARYQAIEELLKVGAKIRTNSLFYQSPDLGVRFYGIGSADTNAGSFYLNI